MNDSQPGLQSQAPKTALEKLRFGIQQVRFRLSERMMY